MVIKNYILLVFLLISVSSFAGFINNFNEGVKAYELKEYDKAVSFFETETEAFPTNSSAFFNLGLAYNAQKQYAKAIWAFEKVLKLEPNNQEAIENIEQNYLELDNGQSWESPINQLERSMYGLSSNFWAYLSIFLSILLSVLLVLLNRSSSLRRKKAFLSGAFVVGILMAFSIYTSSEANYFMNTNDYGLVTKNEIKISSKDGQVTSEENQKILKAGAKVKQIGTPKGLVIQVETMSGETYFINKGDVDFI